MADLLGMFPLQTVLFPFSPLRLHVFEERYQALMAECREREGNFGVVLISRGSEVGGGDQRVDLGTVAHLARIVEIGDGRLLVEAHGTRRVRVAEWLDDDPYPRALVETVDDDDAIDAGARGALDDAKLAVVRLRSLLSELGEVPPIPHDLTPDGHPAEVGWRWCALAPLGPFDRQQLLATAGTAQRMALLTARCEAMTRDVLALLAEGTGA